MFGKKIISNNKPAKKTYKSFEPGDTVLVAEEIINEKGFGRVETGNCLWRAVCTTGENIKANTIVEIVKRDGLIIYVKPISE